MNGIKFQNREEDLDKLRAHYLDIPLNVFLKRREQLLDQAERLKEHHEIPATEENPH